MIHAAAAARDSPVIINTNCVDSRYWPHVIMMDVGTPHDSPNGQRTHEPLASFATHTLLLMTLLVRGLSGLLVCVLSIVLVMITASNEHA